MTREEAKEKWEVIKAYSEGKTIQFYGASGKWFDLGEGFELPVEEKLRIKENRKVKYCYLCGADKPEFTVASKHLFCMLERFEKFDSGTSHITIHICEDCFLKVFDKEIKEKWQELHDENSDICTTMGELIITLERIADLEKENTELKKKNLSYKDAVDMQMYTNRANKEIADKQLTKAKELLKEFVRHYKDKTIYVENMQDLLEQSEQFLNSEVEK